MPQDFLAEARKVLAHHDTWGFMLGGSFYGSYYVNTCISVLAISIAILYAHA